MSNLTARFAWYVKKSLDKTKHMFVYNNLVHKFTSLLIFIHNFMANCGKSESVDNPIRTICFNYSYAFLGLLEIILQ